MVGIVIVSHSKKVAEGIADICFQMAQSELKIVPAGGTEDGRIGTDAKRIKEAIYEADQGDGVLILVDLGSAVMSAETAIELLDEELRKRVIIADAPVVEGSITAVIQASIGDPLEKVKVVAEECKGLNKLG